jgi:beta-galactosidase
VVRAAGDRLPDISGEAELSKWLDGAGRIIHPFLTGSPEPFLWRAPTDNDRIGGMADRWQAQGLDRLDRRLVSIDRAGGAVHVTADLQAGGGETIRHERSIRPTDHGLLVEETITVPEALDDVPRVGIALETVPGFEDATWLGRGPQESYPDRKRGARLGRWQSTVSDLAVPYVRPQENGGRADVRMLELRDGSGRGLRLTFDRPMQVSATHHRDRDLATATHDVELVARPETIVHVDVAHRGLGTASCGPDTLPEYLVRPGTFTWTWALEALDAAGTRTA